ncbi:hypothetical protein M514_01124 [Trichuris suis]|uniref:DNA-3-methyladenine glycosylase n=1 Tax=Trichuris suis TaxID=68888 RepID=A0A085NN88_9BILA|nr:hypothetical protein M513_01124 [Trichuris suis]KFD70934.1 hypothetical protein M514_01124 [Trichuris suis]KHJ45758.1 DNA-3-methyladenine glycosylase [Trichuris suis]
MDLIRLDSGFFDRDCVNVAKDLLGKLLVRVWQPEGGDQPPLRLVVRLVETEAYLGLEDKASHSYKGRRTVRNEAMFMDPGTAYVYNIYGMYQCINISTKGEGAAVLLRAAEPLENVEWMAHLRNCRSKRTKPDAFKLRELCSGPSKLCQALDIRKDLFNQVNLCRSDSLFFADEVNVGVHAVDESNIVQCPRIGIAYAQEWSNKPLRFYLRENAFVSTFKRTQSSLPIKTSVGYFVFRVCCVEKASWCSFTSSN